MPTLQLGCKIFTFSAAFIPLQLIEKSNQVQFFKRFDYWDCTVLLAIFTWTWILLSLILLDIRSEQLCKMIIDTQNLTSQMCFVMDAKIKIRKRQKRSFFNRAVSESYKVRNHWVLIEQSRIYYFPRLVIIHSRNWNTVQLLAVYIRAIDRLSLGLGRV